MIEVGKKYIVKIEGYNHKGSGIAHVDKFVVFIPDVIIGEIVEIIVKKVNKNYGYGEVVDILSVSNLRVMTVCDIYKKCGGCNLQHMEYKEQVNFKENKIIESLEKIGNLKNVKIDKFYSMSIPYEYRNKVQVPFGIVDGFVSAGFYENKSHKIINMDFCHIQFKEANDIVVKTREYMKQKNIAPYDEVVHYKFGKDFGLFRHLLIRKGYNTNEIMVVVVLTEENEKFLNNYVKYLLLHCKNIKTIVLNVNNNITNVILGNYEKVLYGDGYIRDKINYFVFRIHSRSFFQVNTKQAEKLYLSAIDMAELKYSDILLDAYCGIGTIGICSSRRVKKVYGIEEVKESIIDANENKVLNNIKNVEFIHGKVEEEILNLVNNGINITVAILDPPRKGVKESVLHALREIKCKKIVYISCDVGTLARDAKILVSLGYNVSKIRGVDMFCQTHHVETIVCFKL